MAKITKEKVNFYAEEKHDELFKPLFIWGASGHAKVLLELMDSEYEPVKFFFDNNLEIKELKGIPVMGGDKAFSEFVKGNTDFYNFTVAIGHADRWKIQKEIIKKGKGYFMPRIVVDRSAVISPSSKIGTGSHILALSYVGPEVEIGEAVILNTNAQVNHESKIGSGSHLMPASIVTGCVIIGENVMVGSGAVIFPRVKIGDNAVIGAGSVVMHDVPANEVWVGSPARLLRKNA